MSAANASATSPSPSATTAWLRWKSPTTSNPLATRFTRETISEARRTCGAIARCCPFPTGFEPRLPVGFTPLVKAPQPRQAPGRHQSLHQERRRRLPTLSFKDRVVAVALANAQAFGFDTVGCSSTGNLANAVAAQAARLGLKAYILVPSDLEPAKILNTQVYGATLVASTATTTTSTASASQIADEYNWGFVNVNLRPYYAEGSKTVGYEIAEQLGWRLPDNVVVPHGRRLAHHAKFAKPSTSSSRSAWSKTSRSASSARRPPAARPSPPPSSWARDDIEPQRPNTIARSLAIGNPADGPAPRKMIRETAAGPRTSPTSRSSPACRNWPRPKASSPRPPAASPPPSPRASTPMAASARRDHRHLHHRQRPQDHRRARQPLRAGARRPSAPGRLRRVPRRAGRPSPQPELATAGGNLCPSKSFSPPHSSVTPTARSSSTPPQRPPRPAG